MNQVSEQDEGKAWLKRLALIGLLAGIVLAGTILATGIIVCERGGGQLQSFACIEPKQIGVCLAEDGRQYLVPYENYEMVEGQGQTVITEIVLP